MVVLGGEAVSTPAQDHLSPVKPFTHGKHVPDAWLDLDEPERLRDCRGCHNYSLDAPHDPQSVCTNCHFSDDINRYVISLDKTREAFKGSLAALRTPGALFQHSNHEALECRECHRPEGDSIEAPILMPSSGGMALCLECHVGEKERQSNLKFMSVLRDGTPVTPQRREQALVKLQRGLVQALNGSPEMGPNQGDQRFVEPFRHQDHILPDFLGQGTSLAGLKNPNNDAQSAREAQCAVCHSPMFEAAAGFRTAPGDDVHRAFEQAPETCGACHIANEQRAPIEFTFTEGTKSSLTAGTFSHADHLGFDRSAGGAAKASAAGYDSIEADGCAACHQYDQEAPSGFVLADAFRGDTPFLGCQECHSQSNWAPAEHGDWWLHEDHGDWTTCSQCHQFGGDDFATSRLQASVQRRRPGLFHIETQAHPHITVKEGESVEGSCATCHRQPVKALPSRVQEASFNHASHLPANPVAADCVVCHGASVSGAAQSSDIGAQVLAAAGGLQPAGEAALGLTYDPAACTSCHLGSAPAPAMGPIGWAEKTKPRLVPEFSHAAHIGKTLAGGQAVLCSDCHSATMEELASGADFGTHAAALDCTQCHDHSGAGDPMRAASTGGGVTAQEVASCTQCHVGGIPELDAMLEIPYAHIVDIAAGAQQFHPEGQECIECHIPREGLISAQVEESHSRVFVQRTHYSPEESTMAKPAIHRGDTRKLKADRTTCFACHWTNTLVDAADGGSAIPNPETSITRASQGDKLRKGDNVIFPGGNPDDFK